MNGPRALDLAVAKKLMGDKSSSEFGQGFIQNLLYFIEHFGREDVKHIYALEGFLEGRTSKADLLANYPSLESSLSVHGKKALENKINLFMNGSSDHLYDFIIPETLPDSIKKDAEELRELAIDMGHGEGLSNHSFCTIAKFRRLHELCLCIARMLDILVFNVEVDEGEYQ